MKHRLFLAGALLSASLPANAQVVLDLSQITCSQYLDAGADDQMFISSWLSGYFHSERNSPVIDLRTVKKNHAVVEKYCRANKKQILMTAVKKKVM